MNTSDLSIQRLRFIELDLQIFNALEIDGVVFIMMATGVGSSAMIPTQCPHRGGPLHLAQLSSVKGQLSLKCPWHEREASMKSLIRRSLPTIKRGRFVSVCVNATEETTIKKRNILPKLTVSEIESDCDLNGIASAQNKLSSLTAGYCNG